VCRLEPDEVVCLDGVMVTSVARTVVDLARAAPFESAVVTGDAAVALGLTSSAELVEMVRRSSHRPGAARARRVIAFLDGRSESVGESRSRVALARAGLPAPLLQWEVRAADRGLVARVDFGWPEHKLVGEFDGRVKYGRLLKPDQHPGDVVFAEKLREDELRAGGLTVIRWTWRDLDAFEQVAARMRHWLT
jgi:hypothetical protein